MQQFVNSVKSSHGDIKTAVILAGPNELGQHASNWTRHWNTAILKNCTALDAVSFHWYVGPVHMPTNQTCSASSATTRASTAQVMAQLGIVSEQWRAIQAQILSQSEVAARELWVTEYNLFDLEHNPNTHVCFARSWAHTLVSLSMAMRFLHQPNLRVLIAHSLFGNHNFAAITGPPRASGPFRPTAFGIGQIFLGLTLSHDTSIYDHQSLAALAFEGTPSSASLFGVARVLRNDTIAALLLNTSPRPTVAMVPVMFERQNNVHLLTATVADITMLDISLDDVMWTESVVQVGGIPRTASPFLVLPPFAVGIMCSTDSSVLQQVRRTFRIGL